MDLRRKLVNAEGFLDERDARVKNAVLGDDVGAHIQNMKRTRMPGRIALACRTSSLPFIPGITTSVINRSIGVFGCSHNARACSGDAVTVTAWPSVRSNCCVSSRTMGLSSTRRMATARADGTLGDGAGAAAALSMERGR